MIGLFKASGIVIIIITIFMVIVNISYNPLLALLGGISSIIGGLALIALSNTMARLDNLENKLNIHIPSEIDERLLQVTCSKCNSSYDFDYPRCPSCGKDK